LFGGGPPPQLAFDLRFEPALLVSHLEVMSKITLLVGLN
jgi:hypothetical protein